MHKMLLPSLFAAATLLSCGASLVLKQPIKDQCEGAGLQACDKFSDGILKYVDGDKEAGRQKIMEAAGENSEKRIQDFAAKLDTLKQLPGSASFLAPVDEVIAMLKSRASSLGAGSPGTSGAAGTAAAGCPSTSVAARAAPPEGAVGFRFGISPADAEALCKDGWTLGAQARIDNEQERECAKPPVSIGLAAKARLTFSDGRVSGITVEVSPEEGHLANTWRALQQSLEAKYGAPTKKDTQPGAVHVEWTWPDGHSVVLATSTSGPRPHVEIRYEVPKLNVSGL